MAVGVLPTTKEASVGGTIVTAPNTMICCTVYTKRVRKNNTSTYTNLSLKHCIVKCALYQHYAVFEY